MVSGPAAADAVFRARRLPDLMVGLHVALADAWPTLPPERVPGLVQADGRFRDDMTAMGAALAVSPALRRQVAAEVAAQLDAYRSTGLPLDHVDGHKHVHLNPVIGEIVLRLAREHGARGIRVPWEPWRTVRRIDPAVSTWPSRLLAPLTARLRRRSRALGLAVTDRVIGLAWSGAFTCHRLEAALDHLPEGSTELYLHPATRDGFVGSAFGYRYAEELVALTAPAVRARVASHDLRPVGYADLAAGII